MRVAFLLIAAILLQGAGNLCLSQGMKDVASTAAEHPIALMAIAVSSMGWDAAADARSFIP